MKIKLIIVTIALVLFTGCQSNSIKYNHLRAGAITPNNILHESIRIGAVTSSYRKIPAKDLKEAFAKSLSGNDYLSESDKFKINVNLVKGDINGAFTTEVILSIQYEVVSTLTDTIVFTRTIDSKAIAKTSMLAPLIEGLVTGAFTGQAKFSKGIEKTNTYRPSRQEDLEFGFPDPGTPVNAKDATLRIKYATDTSLRKNFAEFLIQLNSTVTESY
ncbi:hypothetical protein [Cellvibrio sp. UBA7661]|uniref:hypothetical protein n=1 Tax=Cellvibrio sp. UBA7661 TaxID=1946311 RepID=UPI002F350B96